MWTKTNSATGEMAEASHEEVRKAALAEVERGEYFGMVTDDEMADDLMDTNIAGDPLEIDGVIYTHC
jgi:hypothetical protein